MLGHELTTATSSAPLDSSTSSTTEWATGRAQSFVSHTKSGRPAKISRYPGIEMKFGPVAEMGAPCPGAPSAIALVSSMRWRFGMRRRALAHARGFIPRSAASAQSAPPKTSCHRTPSSTTRTTALSARSSASRSLAPGVTASSCGSRGGTDGAGDAPHVAPARPRKETGMARTRRAASRRSARCTRVWAKSVTPAARWPKTRRLCRGSATAGALPPCCAPHGWGQYTMFVVSVQFG